MSNNTIYLIGLAILSVGVGLQSDQLGATLITLGIGLVVLAFARYIQRVIQEDINV